MVLTLAMRAGPTLAEPVEPPPVAPLPVAPAEEPRRDGTVFVVLEVRINGRPFGDGAVVAFKGYAAFLPLSFVRAARLAFPAAARISIEGEDYLPLDALTSQYTLDSAQQRLSLTLDPTSFLPLHLDEVPPLLPLSPLRPAAYVNYDLALSRSAGITAANGIIEGGATLKPGWFSSRIALGSGTGPVLLDTTFVRDDRARRQRLALGDALSAGATWVAPVRFTGVRLGSDFTLQPGYQTLPLPAVRGVAALPSDIELYVNSALRAQTRVGQGPFVFDHVPLSTGAGTMALRTIDSLGVERITEMPYYLAGSLLRPGLADYSLELGFERFAFGQSSFAYGAGFASATYRQGLTSSLTAEGHAELAQSVQGAGVGFAATVGTIGELGGALAGSRSASGTGGLMRAYAARSGRTWSLSAVYQVATRTYRQFGQGALPAELLELGAALTPARVGTFGFSLVRQRTGRGEATIESASLTRRLGRLSQLQAYAFASQSSTGQRYVSFGLTLSRALGPRLNATLSRDDGGSRLNLQNALPAGPGLGFRLMASDRDGGQQQGDLLVRAPGGEATLSLAHRPGATDARLLASGGLLFAGGSILPTRRIDGAVAIVDAGGHPGIRVIQDNRVVGRTDRHGIAVVTGLRPYEANRIGLKSEDFDISTRVGSDMVEVVPGARATVAANFGVASGVAAMVRISDSRGQPIAPGTLVRILANGTTLVAGYEGAVFLDDARAGLVLEVPAVDGRPCQAVLPALPEGVTMPELGPLPCAVAP